jgi:hypothetical protein
MKKQISQETMDAMKQLLEHYQNPTEYLEDCPLCVVHKDISDCEECPWALFGHEEIHYHVRCNSWMRKVFNKNGIASVRRFPKEYPEIVKKRIAMLKHWIRNCEVKK